MRLNAWKMNPISRLRMRDRSDILSDCTGFSFSLYTPSEGESSSPKMESNVDFPQPEGPEMATYSPLLISRCTCERACVSTSSVTKTFVTPSIVMSTLPLFSLIDISYFNSSLS